MGAAVLGARGAVVYAFGIAANLLLARLLVPRDFGLVALGTTVLIIGSFVAYGGFSAALVRRREAPSSSELQAVFALQLAIGLAIAAVATAGAAPFGEDGLVVATMAWAIPLIVLRTPAVIVLERAVDYRLIATAEVLEALAYYAWAVGAVAAGLGVWGMATAVVVRAIVGTAILFVRSPAGAVAPRWHSHHVRPLLGFGLKYQAATVAAIAREQLLNVAVGAVAGLATLGVWNLAWRVIQVPTLLFLSVGRVAFAALSRLLDAHEDPRPVVERSLAALAALTCVVVVAMVGLAPGLPEVVGEGWEDVPEVIFWSGLALILSAPVVVVASSFLYAAGEPGAVALATLASAGVWFGVTLPLLDSVGAAAVGIGWVAGGALHALLLWRRTTLHSGGASLARALPVTIVAVGAAVAGWMCARALDEPLAGAALGLVAGEALVAAGLLAFARPAVRDLVSLTRRLRPQAAR